MNKLKIYETVDEVITALAEHVCEVAKWAIQGTGRFNFVLSGGSSPKRLYELLASAAYKDRIDWEKTFFFFGDERFVPEDDSRKNFNMVNQALFLPLKIKKENIFEVDTSETPEKSAENYTIALQKHFGNLPIEFDLTLLGLGDNSHTASLFPYTSVLNEKQAKVSALFIEEADMERITMTAPLINQSKDIAFLVFGKGKAEAVRHILEDKTGTYQDYPARLVIGVENPILWFMDREAASDLKEKY